MEKKIPKPMIMEIPQTNDNGNTKTNDNGNIQSDSGNFQINNNQYNNCDSICQKTIDDAMDMMDNLF